MLSPEKFNIAPSYFALEM